MKKTNDRVQIYMDLKDGFGKVFDSILLAEFIHMNWAEEFIKYAKQTENNYLDIRVVIG